MVQVRRSRSGMGVILLITTIINIGVENIPPVTLALVAGQTVIFLGFLPQYFPSTLGVCVSPYLVVQHRDYRRLILAQLAHGDDMHLYFNMLSLIYKGIKLERKFGSAYFAYLTAVFTGLTSVTYVGLGQLLANVLQDERYLTSCAVGFSGVLFAYKVLATEYSEPGTQYAFGVIPVPSKYIFWAELVLIQMASPNASFIGHLAGILVGLAYTRGPLKLLMDAFFTPEDRTPGSTPRATPRGSNIFSSFGNLFSDNNSPPNQGQGQTTGYRDRAHHSRGDDFERELQQFGPSYAEYTGGLSEQEQMRAAMQESRSQPNRSQPSSSRNESPPLYPDLNDLRNRRSQFYQ